MRENNSLDSDLGYSILFSITTAITSPFLMP